MWWTKSEFWNTISSSGIVIKTPGHICKFTRIKEMIHYKKFLIVKQTLLLATIGNVQRTKCRLCTLMPGRKELMLLPVKRKFKFSREFYLFFCTVLSLLPYYQWSVFTYFFSFCLHTFTRADYISIPVEEDRFTFWVADAHCRRFCYTFGHLTGVVTTQLKRIGSNQVIRIWKLILNQLRQ